MYSGNMRSEVERNLLTLIGDIESHTYNALLRLDSGNNININDFTGEVEHLLNAIRDYGDQYQVIMNIREIIKENKNE
jgi:hypothetical protein